MQTILMSITPKWLEAIASGKKTLEIRKSMPKNITFPCRVVLYCSKKHDYPEGENVNGSIGSEYINLSKSSYKWGTWDNIQGKIVAEFICTKITRFSVHQSPSNAFGEISFIQCSDLNSPYFGMTSKGIYNASCLSEREMLDYIGDNKIGFAWHVSDFKIYKKAKSVLDFTKVEASPFVDLEGTETLCQYCSDKMYMSNESGPYYHCGYCACCEAYENYLNEITIKRPPQSWQYAYKKQEG